MTRNEARRLKYGDRVSLHVLHVPVQFYWFKALDPDDPDMAVLATAPNMQYNVGAHVSLLRRAPGNAAATKSARLRIAAAKREWGAADADEWERHA